MSQPSSPADGQDSGFARRQADSELKLGVGGLQRASEFSVIDTGDGHVQQIKDCSCPGRPEDKPVALTNAILTFCFPQCGGGLASVSDYLHGTTLQVDQLKAELYDLLRDVPPPGKAVLEACSSCGGSGCGDCGSTGKVLWRACPKCGDVGSDFINGRNEQEGMVCRLGCGFNWAADDPRWLAQRLPAKSQAA